MDDVVKAAMRLECLKLATGLRPSQSGVSEFGDSTKIVEAARAYENFVLGWPGVVTSS